jgi:hypothetical protein
VLGNILLWCALYGSRLHYYGQFEAQVIAQALGPTEMKKYVVDYPETTNKHTTGECFMAIRQYLSIEGVSIAKVDEGTVMGRLLIESGTNFDYLVEAVLR